MKKKIIRGGPPISPEAKRVATMFHRQHTTRWMTGEIETFRSLCPIDGEELAMLERYYAAHWPPRTNHNMLRHDLATLLHNWTGEVDRARGWCELHPVRSKIVKVIFNPAGFPEWISRNYPNCKETAWDQVPDWVRREFKEEAG